MLWPFHLSRRMRGNLHRVMGAVALFVWLFMATAEICTPLHEWLHGGSIPDDDDCAVKMIAAGHVHVAVCHVEPVILVSFIEITPRAKAAVFVPSEKNLPNERAPPVPCA
jgi:hypothetical protein